MSWNKKTNGELVKLADLGGGGGGDNANIWYGTHAEYELEKDTIEDGTQVCFTDDIGITAGSEYYSEVEQVIGTYLGKPLYRKVFDLGSNIEVSYNSWTSLSSYVNIPDLGLIINTYAMNEGGTNYPLMCGKTGPNYESVEVQTGRNSNYVTLRYLTIEYTKSTDSEIGIINGIRCGDVYSETEQVIGTWIDGKPLYRKTIIMNELGSGTTSVTLPNDLKMITSFKGALINKNDNKVMRTLPFSDNTSSNNIRVDSDGTYLRVITYADWTNYIPYVTIEYTKSTD